MSPPETLLLLLVWFGRTPSSQSDAEQSVVWYFIIGVGVSLVIINHGDYNTDLYLTQRISAVVASVGGGSDYLLGK